MNGYNGFGPGGQDPANRQENVTRYDGYEWRPQNENGTMYAYSNTAAKPQRGRRGMSPLSVLALILACVLGGFGGGYLAVSIAGGGQTVIYKAPENAEGTGIQNPSPLSVSDIAEKAKQSVVAINTQVMGFAGQPTGTGAGSGVVLSEDGYIITNNHVVQDAGKIVVTLPDGTNHDATLVGTDPLTDIAVLKIQVSGLVPAVLGDSDSLRTGDFCLAVGNPTGALEGTVTDGIISGVNREVSIDGVGMNLLQMSAAVSPGNSGGGLFDASGNLIGIVNAKSGNSNTEGLGFAIPVNTAAEVAGQLIETGSVTGRPALGISVVTIAAGGAEETGDYSQPGVYISQVQSGSPAANAGLKVGDRIASVEGQEIETDEQLRELIGNKRVGDTLELEVERDGERLAFSVKLGEKQLAA